MMTEAKIETKGTRGTAAEWISRALAAGLLMAALVAGSLQAPPAQAADTFTVERTVDTPDANVGDGDCDVSLAATGFQCTLRAAIQEANATPEADLIRFSILDGGTGVQTIQVGAAGFGALPAITAPVTIDGYTQPGASPNTKAVGNDAVLKIELNGASVTGADGLAVPTSSGSTIRGLVINRFGTGISISGDSVANRIEGNFIGTDPTGTLDRGNTFDAVALFDGPSENVVGGTTPAARNVLSGNDDTGIFVSNANVNRFQGNYVGTDKGGTKELGNQDGGVFMRDAVDNTVGGTTAASRNVISANGLDGLDLFGASSGNTVIGNRVGTPANGTGALGNDIDGVSTAGATASNNSIGDGTSAGANTVAFNGNDGVDIASGAGNAISRNSIFSNGGLGIDLAGGFEDAAGNTANDPGDLDAGANGLQNKPILSSAKTVSGKTTITGKLNSAREVGFVVQFFSNPSGNEGKKFVGQKIVVTDTNGNASFAFSPATAVPVGQTVTATATGRGSDTSEFSAPKTVALASGSDLSPETLKVRGPSGVTKSPTAHFKFDSPDPDATFECSLDGGAYYECSSPENTNRLSGGRHTFEVRAVDGEGDADQTPTSWRWEVDRNK